MMRVSVIIPAYNAARDWSDCVASLQTQTLGCVEVIWVDSASTDGSVDKVRDEHPWVKIIRLDRNLGFRGGCRAGANVARGETLVFLNQDVVLDPACLERLLAAFVEPRVGIVAPLVLLHGRDDVVNEAGNAVYFWGMYGSRGLGKPAADFVRGGRLGAVSGCCFAARRPLWDLMGGFSEDHDAHDTDWHAGFEDLDFSWRSQMAGYTVVLEPSAVLWHKFAVKPWEGARLNSLFWGYWITALRNFQVRSLLAVGPLGLAMSLGIFGRVAVRAPRDLMRLVKSACWFWSHRGELMQMRRRVQASRVESDFALFPLMEAVPERWRGRRMLAPICWSLVLLRSVFGIYLRLCEWAWPSRFPGSRLMGRTIADAS